MDLRLTVVAGRAVVQDLGRRAAHRGLSTGGARDQHAARTANALVGSPSGAPLAEAVLGGLVLVPDRDALVAATGAAALLLDGVAVEDWAPVVAPAGCRVEVQVAGGVAACLAVAGAWTVPLLAGSAAPDPGLGFATALEPGVEIAVRGAPARLVDGTLGVGLVRPRRSLRPCPDPGAVDVLPGPDGPLPAGPLVVDPRSDHVGVRLTGDLPPAPACGEPVSRGIPIGAVERPGADGELIVLQRGRSLTAGYPVVAHVPRVAQDRVAQLLPGDVVRLRPRDADCCRAEAVAQRRAEQEVEAGVRAALAAR